MKRVMLGAVLLLLLAHCLSVAQEKVPRKSRGFAKIVRTINDLENRAREAALKDDLSFWDSALAADFVTVFPDGRVGGRQEAIEAFRSGGLRYTSIDISEQQVHLAGNTAVVVFRAAVRGTLGGQSIDGDYRGLRVWVKERGHWRAAASSYARIGDTAGAPRR